MSATTATQPSPDQFWLTPIEAEDPASHVMGGQFLIPQATGAPQAVPVKLIANLSDARVPRLVVRFPIKSLEHCTFDKLSSDQVVLMLAVIVPAVMAVGAKLGAPLVNVRVEGNVAMRPDSKEPKTPHIHFVLRGISSIAGVNATFVDPNPGDDYPLAVGKIGVKDGPAIRDTGLNVTKDAMAQFSKLFSRAMIAEMQKAANDPVFAKYGFDQLTFFP